MFTSPQNHLLLGTAPKIYSTKSLMAVNIARIIWPFPNKAMKRHDNNIQATINRSDNTFFITSSHYIFLIVITW